MTGFAIHTGNLVLSGDLINMQQPSYYLHQIIGYLPNIIEFLTAWLKTPIITSFCWLALICWFIFSLLKQD